MLRKWLREQFNQSIASRNKPAKEHLLARKNLYIFPSRLGFCYLSFTVLLWLLGTNYQNNLLLALSYLQLSIMLVSIFHCYLNMHGIKVRIENSEPVFCGELALIPVLFSSSHQRGHQGVFMSWNGDEQIPLNWQLQELLCTSLALKTTKRGFLQPPRLELRSYYPLGLLRCWCLLSLDERVTVYPSAEPGLKKLSVAEGSVSTAQSDSVHNQPSDEMELADLDRYVAGDSLKLIAWKQYARRGELYKKHYQSHQLPSLDLKWDDYPDANPEQKLQHLCFEALHISPAQEYSLALPTVYLPAACGPAHLAQVLMTLASFDEQATFGAGDGDG